MKPRPRLVPERPLPPYAYVPGRAPHPVSDPAGHSFGRPPEKPPPLEPERWAESSAYLFGFDLFDHGYPWEAHEVWEGLWHACGRRGVVADFLKGLIKLAAAGVKLREGKAAGVRSHAVGARRLFENVAGRLGDPANFLGVRFADVIAAAELTERMADVEGATKTPIVLRPRLPGAEHR